MNNALLVIAGFLIAALTALVAVPYAVDWNGYRGVFEEEASRILGRDVRVGGAVSVRLLPVPYVSFGKLRIADTAGESGEPLFRADSFTLWLSLPPLLRGALEAREIEVKKPVVRVAINEQGQVNWSSLALTPGSLPFVPSSVALQSVRLIDGRVVLQRANGSALAEIDAVTGVLEADTLAGPYRFRGTVGYEGEPREVRFATAPAETDGAVHFKTSVRVPATANSYTLDGRVSGLSRVPRIEGDLVAALTVPRAQATAAAAPNPFAAKPAPPIDLRAHAEADGTGFRLKDIALSLENEGRPQLMTGSAEFAWVEQFDARVALAARWLDLDQLSGSAGDSPPLRTAQVLAGAIARSLPANAHLDGRLTVDQLTMRGQPVSGLSLRLSREVGGLRLDDLKAGLPGGTQIETSGLLIIGGPAANPAALDAAVATKAAPVAFQGILALQGASLARFAGWAMSDLRFSEGHGQGAFLVEGRVALSDSVLKLESATAEIAGTKLSGDIVYGIGERRRLDVRLDASELDVAKLGLDGLDPGALLALSAGSAGNGAEPSAAAAKVPPLDLRLRLRAGAVNTSGETLRDVIADVGLEGGVLKIPRLRLTTLEGLDLDLDGTVAQVPSAPKGTVRYVLKAPDPLAVAVVTRLSTRLLAIDPDFAGRLATLTPLRLAGHLSLGERKPNAADIAADGLMGSGRLTANLRLDGGWRDWRSQPVDLAASIDSSDAVDLIGRLQGRKPESVKPAARETAPASAANTAGTGHLTVKMVGTPASGLAALVSLDGPQIAVSWDGRISLRAQAAPDLDGQATIVTADARTLLAIAGLPSPRSGRPMPLEGTLSAGWKGDELRLGASRLSVAGTAVSGTLSFTGAAAKPVRVGGAVAIDEASLPALLSALVDPAAAPGEAIVSAGLPTALGPWADEPFDLHGLDHVEGQVALAIGSLKVGEGMALTNAKAELDLAPGHLNINHLTGDTLKGKLDAKVWLAQAQAGVELKASGRLAEARLEALPGAGDNRKPEGPVSVSLNVSGRGLSPASLIAGLKGSGEVALGAATLGGMRPEAVAGVADGVLAGRVEVKSDTVAKALAAELGAGRTTIGPNRLSVEIADGTARIAPLRIAGEGGRATLIATVDLAGATVDGEWQLEATRQPAGQGQGKRTYGPLPAVGVVYVGPLRALGGIEPRWSTGAYERELGVRKLEGEVEALERQHRDDEDHVRLEAERSKAVEAERLKATEAARAAAAALGNPAATAGAGAPTVQPSGGAAAAPATAAPPGKADTDKVGTDDAAGTETGSATQPGAAEPPQAPSGNNGRIGLGRSQSRSKASVDQRRLPGDYITRGLTGN